MTFEQFENKFCKQCGTQHCEREGEWLDDCGMWGRMKDLDYAVIYWNKENNTVMSENKTACYQLFNEGITEIVPKIGEYLTMKVNSINYPFDYAKWILKNEINNNVKCDTFYEVKIV